MIIVNQQAELIRQGGDPYELIESVARTCYKSEPQGDAKGFVQRLMKSKHYAMLEHAYIYFIMDSSTMRSFLKLNVAKIKYINIADNYASGSFRAWIELFERELEDCGYEAVEMSCVSRVIYKQLTNAYPDLFTEFIEDTESIRGYDVQLVSRDELINDVLGRYDQHGDWILFKLLPHTFRFITNRAIANELVRHRPASYGQESTRYVGYDRDKFGNQIEVIHPCFDESDIDNWQDWHYAMILCETMYMNMRKRGLQPQYARGVLPLDLKTEIVITATEEEWQHIVNLRYHGTTGAPHPQIKELIGIIYPMLQEESDGRIR